MKWYSGGLCFECRRCGRCCSGPHEGFIWVTSREAGLIADFLREPLKLVLRDYTKRVGFHMTIIERPDTKDCIFYRRADDMPGCAIYPVRPAQCRSWPFWPENLADADCWEKASRNCRGIEQGRHYSFEEIKDIRKGKDSHKSIADRRLMKKVKQIYDWLDTQVSSGGCAMCGQCCDFDRFGHRLFVTSPELLYLSEMVGKDGIKPMQTGRCPYNVDSRCMIYEHRFAGCRIFFCKADKDLQSSLSEEAVGKFKMLCEEFDVPYRYIDLKTALGAEAG